MSDPIDISPVTMNLPDYVNYVGAENSAAGMARGLLE